MDGGDGLSTIWGLGLMKREKKLAHISPIFTSGNPYTFRFGAGMRKRIKKNWSIEILILEK
ncbi:MAG: hypothetical protein GX651_00110 [Methanomicrobiales archaeon]|nr:hypothetical protein [Methanomicrobiales archaeon]